MRQECLSILSLQNALSTSNGLMRPTATRQKLFPGGTSILRKTKPLYTRCQKNLHIGRQKREHFAHKGSCPTKNTQTKRHTKIDGNEKEKSQDETAKLLSVLPPRVITTALLRPCRTRCTLLHLAKASPSELGTIRSSSARDLSMPSTARKSEDIDVMESDDEREPEFRDTSVLQLRDG